MINSYSLFGTQEPQSEQGFFAKYANYFGIPNVSASELEQKAYRNAPLDYARQNNQLSMEQEKEVANNLFNNIDKTTQRGYELGQQGQYLSFIRNAQMESARQSGAGTTAAISTVLSQPASFRYWS